VPIEPFRERFTQLEEQGRLTRTALARKLGFVREDKRTGRKLPDATRAARMVGVEPERSGRYRKRVKYESAVRLCDVLEIDYFEVGV
jgi:hypothetical protein